LKAALAERYEIERELGAGGMATVYLAGDLKHDRKVAIKVMRPELSAILGGERFLREVTIAAKLNHPHILALHDSGEAEEFLYYVMPYVEGESLRAKIEREKQLAIGEAERLTRQVASAIDYAREQGVIHRDIKPENILLHRDVAVVADFGIALAVTAAGGERLTETGLSLGTPEYMSPEQAAADRDVDARNTVASPTLEHCPPHSKDRSGHLGVPDAGCHSHGIWRDGRVRLDRLPHRRNSLPPRKPRRTGALGPMCLKCALKRQAFSFAFRVSSTAG
jgi:serine/threonine-protein kinase